MTTSSDKWLSGDQAAVMDILRASPDRAMSPAEVAAAQGAPRTAAGAAKTLLALYRRGLLRRYWGERTAVFAVIAQMDAVATGLGEDLSPVSPAGYGVSTTGPLLGEIG